MVELMKKICLSIKENPSKQTTFEDFGVDKETFGTAIESCKKEGFIENALVLRGGIGNEVTACGINGARLTFKGEQFIK